ncbi:MAG TPA: LptF/LptG family permease [candidate division Zixibacteria bacterium]|nr:LptF/LptG family permease [candidate division Zixibacteria bacterium]
MTIIKTLDIYLLKKFFGALLVTTLAIGLTIVVINVIDQLRFFIDNDVSLLLILKYYIYFGGWVLKQFLPMFILLATLFSLSLLARKNEILAMKSLGLSLYRLTLPIFIACAALAAFHFYYSEILYPPINEKRVRIKEYEIKKLSERPRTHVNNVYRQIAPGHFYTIRSFNVSRKEGDDLKIYQRSENRLASIITAKKIAYVDNNWRATGGSVRVFDDSLGESFYEFDTMLIIDIKDKPEDFARPLGKPEDMSYAELKSYIDLMKRTGGPFLRESIDLKVKIAFPMTSLVVVLLCVPFAANPRKSGVARSFALGALFSLTYFVLFRVLQSAGYSEKIPEDLAVWGVNGLFFLLGIAAMLWAKK